MHDEGFRDMMKWTFYSYMEDYQKAMGAPSGTDDESDMDNQSDSVDQADVGNQFGSDDQSGMDIQSNPDDQSNMGDWSSVNDVDEDDRINIKVGSIAEARDPGLKQTPHNQESIGGCMS
ncbi:hypothetical protein J4E91_003609 [Alternaria rosae]|nr:hypothetical protein J4E91_003609 [Alternaria rosae]